MLKKWRSCFWLFLGLILAILLANRPVHWLPHAGGRRANIVIDETKSGLSIHPQLWQNFAQGGAIEPSSFSPALTAIQALHPRYIRLDHIFDAYGVYQGNGHYDFRRLDQVVAAIVNHGSLPFFSLSYIPPQLAKNGKITSQPQSWLSWQKLVRATIEHYSGRQGWNLANVYYEVYNEPDLFGHWHYSRQPNYLTLYRYAAQGAMAAANVRPFKLGGPATTGLYPNWIKALLDFCSRRRLRLDFLSWHQYSTAIDDYEKDFADLLGILSNRPQWASIERIVSEFGPAPERSQLYQNWVGAGHDLATAITLLDRVHKIFAFSIMDLPGAKQGWGLLRLGSHSCQPKPRWSSYYFLNQLKGQRIFLTGEGSWVRGVATRQNDRRWQVLLVNYDPNNHHGENVPIRFIHFQPGTYFLDYQFLRGRRYRKKQQIKSGLLFTTAYLPANEAVLITINRQ